MRKKFDRTVVKRCPECDQQLFGVKVTKLGQHVMKFGIKEHIPMQIPVACKQCPCGFHFVSRNKPPTPKPMDTEEELPAKRRRTERTRRERPDFFNALEMETHIRRSRTKQESTSSTNSDSPKKKRGRPRGSLGRQKSVTTPATPNILVSESLPPVEEDMFIQVSAEKAMQYSIVLQDLNRKMVTQHFKPV